MLWNNMRRKASLLCASTPLIYLLYMVTNGFAPPPFKTQDHSRENIVGYGFEPTHPRGTIRERTASYAYTWNNRTGLPFKVDQVQLTSIGFPLTDFIAITDASLEEFLFVTAVTQQYALWSLKTVATIQRVFPRKKIVLYDMGLSEESMKLFTALCNVELRALNFSKLPKHVGSNLKNYAWKLLIIHEVFQEHSGVFWVDSSVRFYSNQTSDTFKKVRETGGVAFFVQAGHSNYAVATRETLGYLKTDVEKQKTTWQSGATVMLLYKTRRVYENIMKWGVLCSLDEDCIARGGVVKCEFDGNDKWAHCSRFDQTVVNILGSNHYGFDNTKYTSENRMFDVRRGPEGDYPSYCGEYSSALMLRLFLYIV